VPVHPKDLKRGLLSDTLKDAGISREEFQRLL
jgi:predicted RNA binding protein YcfA (HicA-like mRNA interferase family)